MSSGLFALTEYCTIHQVDPSFVESLEEEGLIMVVTKDRERFIHEEQLPTLEVFTRWHVDMGINTQGIDAMHNLITKIHKLHIELNEIRQRLRLYESGEEFKI
jgi:hypothetical protein